MATLLVGQTPHPGALAIFIREHPPAVPLVGNASQLASCQAIASGPSRNAYYE